LHGVPMRLRLAAVLVARVGADAYDIHVELYKDANCFEAQETRMFTMENCYANYWANQSLGAAAFDLTIVSLKKPNELLSMSTYGDNCLGSPLNTISLRCGQCNHFSGQFYGIFSIHFRSDCFTEPDCASILTAKQYFYDNRDCAGPQNGLFMFPLARLPTEHAATFGRVITIGMPGYEEVGASTTTGGFTGSVGASSVAQQQSVSTQIAMSIGSGNGAFFDIPPDRNGGGRRRRRTTTCTQQCAECLKAQNGTMLFFTNAESTQVFQFNFYDNHECDSTENSYDWLAYTVGHCYPGIIYDKNNVEQLYSFMWQGDIAVQVLSLAWVFGPALTLLWHT